MLINQCILALKWFCCNQTWQICYLGSQIQMGKFRAHHAKPALKSKGHQVAMLSSLAWLGVFMLITFVSSYHSVVFILSTVRFLIIFINYWMFLFVKLTIEMSIRGIPAWITTYPVNHLMKLLIQTQTSMTAPLKLGNGFIVSSHTSWWVSITYSAIQFS